MSGRARKGSAPFVYGLVYAACEARDKVWRDHLRWHKEYDNLWRKLCTKLNEKGGGVVPEKTIKRRLEELEWQLAADDGPIFSTVAKLVRALFAFVEDRRKNFVRRYPNLPP